MERPREETRGAPGNGWEREPGLMSWRKIPVNEWERNPVTSWNEETPLTNWRAEGTPVPRAERTPVPTETSLAAVNEQRLTRWGRRGRAHLQDLPQLADGLQHRQPQLRCPQQPVALEQAPAGAPAGGEGVGRVTGAGGRQPGQATGPPNPPRPHSSPLVQHLELDALVVQDAAQPPVPPVQGQLEVLPELCRGGN